MPLPPSVPAPLTMITLSDHCQRGQWDAARRLPRPGSGSAQPMAHNPPNPQARGLDVHELAELGRQLRVDAVRCSAAASSGHPTSSMSAADLIAVLAARHLRYDFEAPDNPNNDHLIFSKGHASPLVYALYKAAGAITAAELQTYREA